MNGASCVHASLRQTVVEEVHVEGRSGEELPALVARAEAEAIDAALLENARALVAFLGE